jgi:phospholipase C
MYRRINIMRTSSNLVPSIFVFLISLLLVGSLTANASIYDINTIVTPSPSTVTPIKHLVVIFQENVSFDHYFATYPFAKNLSGEPSFSSSPNTPFVNNLRTAGVLDHNPNSVLPFRIDRSHSLTCDNNHTYTAEQKAFDGGKMDKFVESTFPPSPNYLFPYLLACERGGEMGYFDGNTVTALWNYAQHFSMSDNFFGSTFGPSTPGHINLISGQTHGTFCVSTFKNKDCKADPEHPGDDALANETILYDPDPTYDDCSISNEDYIITHFVIPTSDAVPAGSKVYMQGRNIGDLLNAKGITWGWFSGGFKPTPFTLTKNCGHNYHTPSVTSGVFVNDYYPTVEPFQYYQSTSNPHHLPPTAISMIGHSDQANHQYDLSDFWNAAESGNLPSVSYLKAPSYQQEHPGISDPLLGQKFFVDIINRLQNLPEWNSTAVIITYDDSDGWYDHVMPPIVSQSSDPKRDALYGKTGLCGHTPAGSYQDRCGYGPRLPILIISPFAKVNYIDHSLTDTSSILRFIEDNWLESQRIGDQSFDQIAGSLLGMFDFKKNNTKIFLDPDTGTVINKS